MMATAAFAAGVFLQFGFGREPAHFERLGNEFLDGFLHAVKFFLSIEKTACDGIAKQNVTLFFKLGDFDAVERLAAVLFVVKRLAFVHQRFVLTTRAVVGHEGVNALADGNHFRLGDDGLAQLPGLFFNFCGHINVICADNKPQSKMKSNPIDNSGLNG